MLNKRHFNIDLAKIGNNDIKLVQIFILEELEKKLNLSLLSKVIDSIDKVKEIGIHIYKITID